MGLQGHPSIVKLVLEANDVLDGVYLVRLHHKFLFESHSLLLLLSQRLFHMQVALRKRLVCLNLCLKLGPQLNKLIGQLSLRRIVRLCVHRHYNILFSNFLSQLTILLLK